MKIWVQSSGPVGEPTHNAYEKSLQRHVQKVARPGTRVDIHYVDLKPPGRDRYFSSMHLSTTQIIKSALHAEEDGYDAVAAVCTPDHGYHELREMVNIPVVSIVETSLHLACQLAPKFAFLTHNAPMLLRLIELVKKYGMTERMTPGRYLDLTVADYGKLYINPEPYLAAITQEARKIIKQGADILLLFGNPINMFALDHSLREIDGVPILDVCGATIKVAELMVDLKKMGITRSRSGLFSVPSQEEQTQLRKLYEQE